MAGIEKICEMCEKYCGYKMYGYKRNQLQICPSCRKDLKYLQEEVTINILDSEKIFLFKSGGYASYSEYEKRYFNLSTDDEYLHFISMNVGKCRLVNSYKYSVTINGQEFINYSYNLTTVVRKIKRMFRPKNVIIRRM